MKISNLSQPWLRLMGALCALALLVSGVTFASIQSQDANLVGSKISSATANLEIGDGQTSYGQTMPGFNFADIEPGATPAPTPGYKMYLHNNGTAPLKIHLYLRRDAITNPQNANLNRIFLTLTSVGGTNSGGLQQFPLGELLAANPGSSTFVLNTNLAPGQIAQYSVQMQIAADAVTSNQSNVNISGIDLTLYGESVLS